MQDLRLYFPGQLAWLAQAVEETGLVGSLLCDGESLNEWCEGEALKLPVRVNLTRAKRDGEMEISAPVFVRLFTRYDEPVQEAEVADFAVQLALALTAHAHAAVDIGTMGYDGGEDYSFTIETSLPAR